MEAAQIGRELAPHYFLADCFGGSSDLAGTGSTLFSGGLFWRQLRVPPAHAQQVYLFLHLSFYLSVRAKRGIWSKRVFMRTNGNYSFSVH
jgi:hypothetical protein